MPGIKRPGDEAGPLASADFDACVKKAKLDGRTFTAEEVQELVEREVRKALAGVPKQPKPDLLQETFTPNDNVHGLIHLPQWVKQVVDTRVFQRMRHIKQLGICSLVYPGGVHNRFFHSIGTAYLAYDLVKGLQLRQPELAISNRDVICATMAGLCHDLGHPCFSHMFEHFVHGVGHDLRKEAEKDALSSVKPEPIPEATMQRIERLENWSHEDASVRLLDLIFTEKAELLRDVGLRVDDEGDDFACIRELIDPPKKVLERLLEDGTLRQDWSKHMKGRPVDKAWLYEVVSNWRSGIDVDKFDYFRRDAFHLGIHKQFDHDRYMSAVCVLPDRKQDGVPTLSPPDKERDSLRENMLELRKSLHRSAYQHKTVKKLEMHMIDILKMMDKHVSITGTGGQKFSMSEAAVQLDSVAYMKLTDDFIQSKLMENTPDHNGVYEIPELQTAAEEYNRRIVQRDLMRLVADWDVEQDMTVSQPDVEAIINGVLESYKHYAPCFQPSKPVVTVSKDELRCEVCAFHYGMKFQDPITRVLFHSSKDKNNISHMTDIDANPMRQKVFCFWNPTTSKQTEPLHQLTLQRLTLAFEKWAHQKADTLKNSSTHQLSSPNRLSPNRVLEAPSPSRGETSRQSVEAEHRAAPASPPPKPTKARRSLKIAASCPPDMDDFAKH